MYPLCVLPAKSVANITVKNIHDAAPLALGSAKSAPGSNMSEKRLALHQHQLPVSPIKVGGGREGEELDLDGRKGRKDLRQGGNGGSFCCHFPTPLEPGGLTWVFSALHPLKCRHRVEDTYCWLRSSQGKGANAPLPVSRFCCESLGNGLELGSGCLCLGQQSWISILECSRTMHALVWYGRHMNGSPDQLWSIKIFWHTLCKDLILDGLARFHHAVVVSVRLKHSVC